MLALVSSILSFLMLVIGEYFEAKKRARLKEQAFELDQKTRDEIFDSALVRLRAQAAKASHQAQDLEDRVDSDSKDNNQGG